MKKIIFILFILSCSQTSQTKKTALLISFTEHPYKKNIISTEEALKIVQGYIKKRELASNSEIDFYTDDLNTCDTNPDRPFDSSFFPDWENSSSCKDTRQHILYREHNKIKNILYKTKDKCEIESGEWLNFFSDKEKITESSKANVSLTVPPRNAYDSGAYLWNLEKRSHYINNLQDDFHHIISSSGYIRARSGKYPGKKNENTYLPKNNERACTYLGSWITIKKKWNLCATTEEKISLREMEEDCRNNYNRKYWKHWIDEDNDCFNSRQEALIKDANSLQGYSRKGSSCSVIEGQWIPFYKEGLVTISGNPITNPKDIDVDHFVPLKNAHINGGWMWSSKKKMQYANYLNDQFHLLSVSASENRSKGAKGPEQYLPPNINFHCDYIKIWVQIKNKWNLKMNRTESNFIENYLTNHCT